MLMFWLFTVVFVLCVIGMIWSLVNGNDDEVGPFCLVAILILVFGGIWGGVSTGALYSEAGTVKYSKPQLELQEQKRDELLKMYDEVLDPALMAQVAQATVPEDVTLILGNQQNVSQFLVDKAAAMADANRGYFEARDKIMNAAKNICSSLDNPMMLRAPFLSPDCPFDALTEVPG